MVKKIIREIKKYIGIEHKKAVDTHENVMRRSNDVIYKAEQRAKQHKEAWIDSKW